MTNCIHYVILANHFIPQLLKRKQKSGIIFTSSIVSESTIGSAYGATKKFNEYWAEFVNLEYGSDKLDVYCLKPGVV